MCSRLLNVSIDRPKDLFLVHAVFLILSALAFVQNQYVHYYGPMANGNNYTSPLLHTIKLTGLEPKTQYFYQCAVGGLCAHT